MSPTDADIGPVPPVGLAPSLAAIAQAPIEVIEPERLTSPCVFASPHSGRRYPAEFVTASKLDPVTLRRSEDAFMDEVFGAVPSMGAPMLKAHFPRAYVDPNREPWELDPTMFAGPLPDFVNVNSIRVSAGLGTVARVVTNGADIYRDKLDFDEVKARIEALYMPYHQALRDLINRTVERFGVCLLIDIHSMPSIGGPMDADPGLQRVDFVLGDGHGTASAPMVIGLTERVLAEQGYRVARNSPYSGGFTTRHYGQPQNRVHALQIETNRALYMDELAMNRAAGMPSLIKGINRLLGALTAIKPEELTQA